MKKLFLLSTLCLLTACDSLQSSSKVASPSPSTSPSPTSELGPTSSNAPTPSPTAAINTPDSLLTAESRRSSSPAPSVSTTLSPTIDTNVTIKGKDEVSTTPNSTATPNTIPTMDAMNPFTYSAAGVNNGANKSETQKSPKQSPQTISAEGIGEVKLGMTLGDLKKNLKDITWQVKSDFAVDYSALAVIKKGVVQFYIPYQSRKKLTETDKVRFLVTENSAYKTEQGISPGMTIKQAAAVYGAPSLRLQKETESGEILTFAQQPLKMAFSTGRSTTKVGIYPKANVKGVGASETNQYREQAKIKRITVVCDETICGQE